MNDFMGMHIFESWYDLDSVALYFELMQTLSSSQQLVHRLTFAKFEQYVDTFIVFKEVLETNYMPVH